MSLLRRSPSVAQQVADRVPWRRSAAGVGQSEALRMSTTWAAIRLRADLVSQLPVDVFRKSPTLGIAVEVPKPQVLRTPARINDELMMSIDEWLYSSQTSLDRVGNVVGVIRATDGFGLPAEIELVEMDEVSMRVKNHKVVEYRINGEKVAAKHIWHERQHTFAGLPVGLSPITYAALSLEAGLSAKQFAVDWFGNGAVPSAHLKNSEKVLDAADTERVKARFQRAITNGDVFVTGKDWEYNTIQAKAAEAQFLEQTRATDQDLCRFLGVPADLVDVSVDSQSITYANSSQRNVQLLVMNMGSAIKRRDTALTRLVPGARYVKLNRSAILAMDDATRADVTRKRILSREMTPDEARELADKPPLTDAQIALFGRLFGEREVTEEPING